jgi:hypothetical protein
MIHCYFFIIFNAAHTKEVQVAKAGMARSGASFSQLILTKQIWI